MKTKLPLILLALLLVIPALALSAPMPSSYEDAAWADLIENAKGTALPATEPLGNGAVSAYNGEGYWPMGFLQIYKPIDLKSHSGLVFSQTALDNGRYFASETMLNFLEATLEAFRQLDSAHKAVLPIMSLFYDNNSSLPMRNMSEATLAVELGVFIIEGSDSVPLAFAQISDAGVQKGTTRQINIAQNDSQRYRQYADGMRPHLPMLKSLASTDLNKKIFELQKDIREKAQSEKAAEREENKNSLAAKTRKPNPNAKIRAIEKQYQARLDEIHAKILEAKGDERTALAQLYIDTDLEMEREIEAQKIANDPDMADILRDEHAFYDELDAKIRTATFDALTCVENCQKAYEKVDDLEAERRQLHESRRSVLRDNARQPNIDRNRAARSIQFNEERNRVHEDRAAFNQNKRMSKAQKSAARNDAAPIEKIDIARTWAMFEAMFTQTVVPIADITMPITLKEQLLEYANSAGRPADVINAFNRTTLTSQDGRNIKKENITVHLMCSARDRFLGCQLGGNPKIEEKISAAASQILKITENTPRSTQFRAIEYVVRSNPVELTYKPDTKALRKSITSMLGKSRQNEYKKLLRSLDRIPLRGENPHAPNMRKNFNSQNEEVLDL